MRYSKLAVILLLLISVTTFSQSTTNSPYSKYGIGIIRNSTNTQSFGMGGVGIGMRSSRDLYLQNPASYSGITVTTFDVGYTNNALWLDDGTEKQYQNNPYIDHLAFAIPMVKNVWGMSFGILPFSNVGYDYDEIRNDPIAGDVSIYNRGIGAINKVYLGNSIGIKLDSSSVISVGANVNFLFGSINYDQKAIYGDLPNAFNLWEEKDLSVADFGTDLGMQYQKVFTNEKDEKINLTVGATYGLATDLRTKRTELLRTFSGNIDFGTIKDTVSFIDNVDDIVQLPSELGFGVSLEKVDKWIFAIDYKTSNWSSIVSNQSVFTYRSNYSLAAGVQFIPKNEGSSYLQRIAYRLGTKFSNSYIAVNNAGWNEYGITFGMGFPIRRSETSYPRLNLGFEYGNRGTTDAGLIKEKFLNFNVGITINAIWFRKRKYD